MHLLKGNPAELGMMAYACNLSTWNLRQEDYCESETSLGHTVSFRSDCLQTMGQGRWLAGKRTSVQSRGPEFRSWCPVTNPSPCPVLQSQLQGRQTGGLCSLTQDRDRPASG